MLKLSVIIPTLNEAELLGATLEALGSFHEIIVVDGGSHDNTRQITERCGAMFEISETPGRAGQMNRGARIATGTVLVFLHADTLVPSSAPENLLDAFGSDKEMVGGGFFRFFASPSIFLKLSCHLANFRSKHWGIFLGDQAIFVRKEIFEQLNGFRETLPFGEDLDFSLRMKQVGRWTAIQSPVTTSPRRFHRLGPVRQTLLDLWLTSQVLRLRRK